MPRIANPTELESTTALVIKITSGTEQQAYQWLKSKEFADEWQKIWNQCTNNRQARRLLILVKRLSQAKKNNLSTVLKSVNLELSYLQKKPVSTVISVVDSLVLAMNKATREQVVGSTVREAIGLAFQYAQATKAAKIEYPLTFRKPRHVEWDLNPEPEIGKTASTKGPSRPARQ